MSCNPKLRNTCANEDRECDTCHFNPEGMTVDNYEGPLDSMEFEPES